MTSIEFKRKYPKIYANFEVWRAIFAEIESKIEDTIIFETESELLPPAAMDTVTYPGKIGIRIRTDIAEELEKKGYFLTAYMRYEQLDELMFHEFLHVLSEYKPELFIPHPLVIDFVPARVTHFKPPKTAAGILERIKIINKWWERYAEEEYPARRYAWLKKKYGMVF